MDGRAPDFKEYLTLEEARVDGWDQVNRLDGKVLLGRDGGGSW